MPYLECQVGEKTQKERSFREENLVKLYIEKSDETCLYT